MLLTPYITPLELLNSGTGEDWGQLYTDVHNSLASLCKEASDMIDNECGKYVFRSNRPYMLRASETVGETGTTDIRDKVMIDRNNNLVFVVDYRPIISVKNMTYQVLPGNSGTTQNIVTIPSQNYSFEGREITAFGFYSGSIGPASMWGLNYMGGYGDTPLRVTVDYINGVVNTELSVAALAGATSIVVQDPTGILVGDMLTLYDVGPEYAVVDSTYDGVSSTIPLVNPLVVNHGIGVRVSEMDGNLRRAAIYMAISIVQMKAPMGIIAANKLIGNAGVPMNALDYKDLAVEMLDNWILTP